MHVYILYTLWNILVRYKHEIQNSYYYQGRLFIGIFPDFRNFYLNYFLISRFFKLLSNIIVRKIFYKTNLSIFNSFVAYLIQQITIFWPLHTHEDLQPKILLTICHNKTGMDITRIYIWEEQDFHVLIFLCLACKFGKI